MRKRAPTHNAPHIRTTHTRHTHALTHSLLFAEQKPIRSVLINGMCIFEDEIGAAMAATAPNAELDGMYERLRHVVAEPAHKAWWHN